MHSPSPPTTTTTTTYTTIPISAADVISRSLQNLTSAFSLRPSSEFFSSGGFDCPDSPSSAKLRLLRNTSYFRLNYALVLLSCALLSLILSPLSLLIISAIVFVWLLLYFYREDPLIIHGWHVSDRWVLVGLVVVSVISIWGLGVFWNLVIGAGIGVLVLGAHGVFRNGDGLFLGEEEAASRGLIVSGSGSGLDGSRKGAV